MFLFALLQLSAISLNAGSHGRVGITHVPLKVMVVPAGERDGDCAALMISAPGNRGFAIRHAFCRSARIYDMKSQIVIVNENVNLSTLCTYRLAKGLISKKCYHSALMTNGSVDAISFDYEGGTIYESMFDVILREQNERKIGPEKIYYECLRVGMERMSTSAGKCEN